MSIILHTKNTKPGLNTLIRLATLSVERPMDMSNMKQKAFSSEVAPCALERCHFLLQPPPHSDSDTTSTISLNDFQTRVSER